MNRGAKNKTQVLLLNIFAFTDAANIYSKHYAEGVTQMLVFLALIIVIIVWLCTCMCHLIKDNRYDIVGNHRSNIITKMICKLGILDIIIWFSQQQKQCV